jgi:hypothetical protein
LLKLPARLHFGQLGKNPIIQFLTTIVSIVLSSQPMPDRTKLDGSKKGAFDFFAVFTQLVNSVGLKSSAIDPAY